MDLVFAPLPYHQQDLESSCGPAIAQMVLGSLGVPVAKMESGVLTGHLMQTVLQGNVNACGHEDGWNYTSPDALVCVLNAKRPLGERNFIVSADNGAGEACARIAATIVANRVAVPAIVLETMHWVAVHGVAYDEPGGANMQASIRGFYFNNPMPFTPAARGKKPDPASTLPPYPMPHCDRDACGAGDDYGTSFEYATIYGWLQDYWASPCRIYQSYVTISSVPLPDDTLREFSTAPPPMARSNPLANKEAAMAAAAATLLANDVANKGPLAALIGKNPKALSATPFALSSQPDVVVYYVVRFECGDRFANASFDALTGQLRGVQVPAGLSIPDDFSARIAYTALQAQWSDFRYGFNDQRISLDEVFVDPPLIAFPSRLSSSPFRPFAKVCVRDQTLFLGPDGNLYGQVEAGGTG